MSNLVRSDRIETLVGTSRSKTRHFARAVSAEQKDYILHSKECLDSVADLRECEYSIALDHGISEDDWLHNEDKRVEVRIHNGFLVPKDGAGR